LGVGLRYLQYLPPFFLHRSSSGVGGGTNGGIGVGQQNSLSAFGLCGTSACQAYSGSETVHRASDNQSYAKDRSVVPFQSKVTNRSNARWKWTAGKHGLVPADQLQSVICKVLNERTVSTEFIGFFKLSYDEASSTYGDIVQCWPSTTPNGQSARS
jgi:hypothetical protein